MLKRNKFFSLSLIAVVLSGCNALPDWVGADDETPVPGKRVSVLAHRTSVEADSKGAKLKIRLPSQKKNNAWQYQYTQPKENVALGDSPSLVDVISIGDEPGERMRLATNPVIARGVVYALDGEGTVSARKLDALDKPLWQYEIDAGMMQKDIFGLGFDLDGKTKKEFLGGSIGYSKGILYVTTTHGEVIALNTKNQNVEWTRDLKLPIRSAPIVSQGMVYVITSENKLYALDTDDGTTRWTHEGLAETTTLQGFSSPTIYEEIIVVPYSSGELHVLDKATGRPRWNDVLISRRAARSVSIAMNDIRAVPLVHNGSVYAVSHDGVLSAYNVATGTKRWTQALSASETPWAAGNFLYILTSDNELVAVHTLDGTVKWVSELPLHSEASIGWSGRNKGEKISWQGPVLAGGKLWLTGSHGEMIGVSPKDGQVAKTIEINEETYLRPVVADKQLFTLSNDAELSVYK